MEPAAIFSVVATSCQASTYGARADLARGIPKEVSSRPIDRCRHPMEQALSDAKLTAKNIDRVILVGGPTRMPVVQKFVEDYGDDSDFVRIRVYGVFPRVGEMEFFNASEIADAMSREAATGLSDPLALGVDVARYGKNSSVIYPRKGRDARTYPRERFQGLSTDQLADKVFEANFRLHADGIMVDGGGVGGGAEAVPELVVELISFFTNSCWRSCW